MAKNILRYFLFSKQYQAERKQKKQEHHFLNQVGGGGGRKQEEIKTPSLNSTRTEYVLAQFVKRVSELLVAYY